MLEKVSFWITTLLVIWLTQMVIWRYLKIWAVSPVKAYFWTGRAKPKDLQVKYGFWDANQQTMYNRPFSAVLILSRAALHQTWKESRLNSCTIASLAWSKVTCSPPSTGPKLPSSNFQNVPPGTCFEEWCDPHIASKPCHKVHAVLQPEQALEIAVPRNNLGCASRTQTTHAT